MSNGDIKRRFNFNRALVQAALPLSVEAFFAFLKRCLDCFSCRVCEFVVLCNEAENLSTVWTEIVFKPDSARFENTAREAASIWSS